MYETDYNPGQVKGFVKQASRRKYPLCATALVHKSPGPPLLMTFNAFPPLSFCQFVVSFVTLAAFLCGARSTVVLPYAGTTVV